MSAAERGLNYSARASLESVHQLHRAGVRWQVDRASVKCLPLYEVHVRTCRWLLPPYLCLWYVLGFDFDALILICPCAHRCPWCAPDIYRRCIFILLVCASCVVLVGGVLFTCMTECTSFSSHIHTRNGACLEFQVFLGRHSRRATVYKTWTHLRSGCRLSSTSSVNCLQKRKVKEKRKTQASV